MITIVGLGPGSLATLTLETLQVLETTPCILLRTEQHPAAVELRGRGIRFVTLDAIYDTAGSFPEVYEQLAQAVLERARQGDVAYAVPGHPLVGEESVRILIERARAAGLPLCILPATSFVDASLVALAGAEIEALDFTHLQILDAAALGGSSPARSIPSTTLPTLLYQVDDQVAASRVKIALMEVYPDDHRVGIVSHAGIAGEQSVICLPLYQMDRPAAGSYDHLTSVYVPPLPPARRRPDFHRFVEVIARLRAPDGCPWDREQNYESLKRTVIEEAYEVLDAIDSGDPEHLREELGDLMLQVLMYAQFAREDGDFGIDDVVAHVVEKLVRRHPHVFGDATASTSDEVLTHWERIKRTEKPERESVLDGVPRHLPALMKATEVSKRVVRVGFEWPVLEQVFDKLAEETVELREAIAGGDPRRQQEEIGDLLFTVVNIARWLKVDPEEALRAMVDRFSTRFREVERLAAQADRPLAGMGIDELDDLWEQAKRKGAG